MLSLIIMFGIMILLIWVEMDTTTFFFIQLFTILILQAFNTLLQTTMYQICGVLPGPVFANFIQGQGIGGVVPTILGIACAFIIPEDKQTKASVFYVLAVGFVVISLALLIKFKNRNQKPDHEESTKMIESKSFEDHPSNTKLLASGEDTSAWCVITTGWKYYAAIYINFLTTLAIFPVMIYAVKPTNYFWFTE